MEINRWVSTSLSDPLAIENAEYILQDFFFHIPLQYLPEWTPLPVEVG
jgi:hypothetical protein